MKFTEYFRSIQGEGVYTGNPSIWLRFFMCNLECRGFGQKDPTDPSTHEVVGNDINVTDVTSFSDLPVFQYGCDSAYSVSKKYKSLAYDREPTEVVEMLDSLLPKQGIWNQQNGYEFDMVFTGGEPLTKISQKNIAHLLHIWKDRPGGHRPERFTFETNGTMSLSEELIQAFNEYKAHDVLLSYSPKLFTVSGEQNKKAIKPAVIHFNDTLAAKNNWNRTYKFVLTPEKRAWDELETVIDQLNINRRDVWIMPVGGRVEEQEATAGDVADMAVERGYKVAARVHAYLYGNAIGK